MASKLDELRRRAEQAARDLNEKYDIKSKVDQGTRAATDAFRKGVEVASSGIDVAREEVSRIDREHKVSESVSEGAKRATETARKAATTAE